MTPNPLENLVHHIVSRLESCEAEASKEFNACDRIGARSFSVDQLLPEPLARQIHCDFPDPQGMRLMSSFRERKYTSKNFDQFKPVIKDVTFAFQDPRVVQVIERITGIQGQMVDPSLYAGGISAMDQGHFLGPHLDNSHDSARKVYRTLNLLYYITPDWDLSSGGNLELWDDKVREKRTVISAFNRLVVMETNQRSWHSVCPIRARRLRCCVSNYYFSPQSPTGSEYFNVTVFSARPEQKVRRMLAWADGHLRRAVRCFIPSGVGKRDVFTGGPK